MTSPRHRRQLRREADGSLYDVERHRRVDPLELRDDLRGGRRFRVTRHDTGEDCTIATINDLITGGPSTGVSAAALGGFLTRVISALDGLDLAPRSRPTRAARDLLGGHDSDSV